MGWIRWLLAVGLAAGQDARGLLVNASDGQRTVRFAAASPNFYLEKGESLHPALRPEFRAEFRGWLTVLRNGEYEFDQEVQLNGKAGRIFTLAGGKHALAISYRRNDDPAVFRLQWRSSAFDWEPVPQSAFTRPADTFAAEEGRTLVERLGCASCHGGGELARRAEALTGGRSRGWLDWWLSKPRERMPHLLNEKQRPDVVAYLASLPSPPASGGRKPNEVDIGKGGELFGTIGCSECHALTGLGSKYSYPAILARVSQHRPSMLLKPEESVALAASLHRSVNPDWEKAPAQGDADAGSRIVQSAGCLACHARDRLENRLPAARRLAELRSADCDVAMYELTAKDREAIAAFLNSGVDVSPAPVYQLPRRLAELGCLECHRPGTEAPLLEGSGEKLKSSWLERVLWGKERIRPGRELRMPHYDQAEVAGLVPAFAKAEGLAPGDGQPPPAFGAGRRAIGHGLLGTNPKSGGMACIGCHDWGAHKSLGEEGPQLINATERMRWEWYERWMRNPARILSGTSMPGYFVSMPKARAAEVIGNLWAGVEWGRNGPVPDGYQVSDLGRDKEARPAVDREAVIVRWDMPEATPAAIAVGLPGGFSYCFDAGASQVLYAWRGGFVDLSGTLLRKTDKHKLTPTAELVGEIFWKSTGYPIRVGDNRREPSRRFRGYRLIGSIPEFRYEVDGIEVREKLEPVAGAQAIRREFVFSVVDRPIWLEGKLVPQGKNVRVETRIGQ